ncbi:probable serine carboxypeptidase CPVL [Rhipicephalus sanguineus]|uniref:Serine carboxypeptidase n=1 Tax=Rhipicephalus sanguineus TaxID=34632 RepID=A0A9D4PZW0_RHISA|nr:probable serine carboxypeptidase CPVL [Rhipicephalus sanguineus]KAH7961923.1 hypothetical protein HPB52_013386 [Rhipicephalus sanguineus]
MRRSCDAGVSTLAVIRQAGALLLAVLVLLQCQCGDAWPYRHQRKRAGPGATRNEEELPLYLTPYVVQGRVRDARERSRVGAIGGSPDIESYAGFLTVRERQLNHLFFWFFPAIKKHPGGPAPLVLWLQGGPGVPSVMGALVEHGPLRAIADGTTAFRAHTWAQEASVVYVDQPVGTGFSHSHDGVDDGWYCANASDAAADLYEFMGQFCVIFAECHRADFFIAAESYAAKFALTLATMMNMMRDEDSLPRLKGLVLASPFVDPENQLDNSELLHQTGFLTDAQAALLWEQYNRVVRLIRRGNYTTAKDLLEVIIDGNPTVSTTLFGNLTGLRQAYDLDLTYPPAIFSGYEQFVERAEVRRALHVGRQLVFVADGDAVTHGMYADILVSYKHQLADLLDQDLKVLVYCGQKDLLTPLSSVERFMKTVNWKGQRMYATTPRLPWRLGTDQVLGYYRHVHNYTEVLVRGAGHVTAFDKPKEVLALVTRFIYGAPIDDAR